MKIPKSMQKLQTPSHTRSRAQEREIAKRLGGRTVRGSGNGREKGDVRVLKVCRIEAKTTKHSSFSVTSEMIEKIETAAICSGELPCFVVEFLTEDGKPLKSVAVCPMWVLDILSQPRA